MATAFFKPTPVTSTATDWYERMLAAVAAILFAIVIVGLGKGRADWAHVPLMAPRVWLTARKNDLAAHRRTVRGLVTGALVVAGYFTLLETRLLGHWLFG